MDSLRLTVRETLILSELGLLLTWMKISRSEGFKFLLLLQTVLALVVVIVVFPSPHPSALSFLVSFLL